MSSNGDAWPLDAFRESHFWIVFGASATRGRGPRRVILDPRVVASCFGNFPKPPDNFVSEPLASKPGPAAWGRGP